MAVTRRGFLEFSHAVAAISTVGANVSVIHGVAEPTESQYSALDVLGNGWGMGALMS
ncbi:MAG: hypothetical protein ABW196_11360 [Solirubrobacterales bacterium]